MAHDIYKEKFYSHRESAWHGLGIVNDEKLNAIETAKLINIPVVDTVGVKTADDVVIPSYKVIRVDGVPSTIVSSDYYEITHSDFIDAWNEATGGAYVETMGVLANGNVVFISTKLPSFDVKGVQHDNYLMATNPVTGMDAATALETVIRVVCANTLRMSLGGDMTTSFRCTHTKNQRAQMEAWMKDLWESRLAVAESVKEACTILADKSITSQDMTDTLGTVYPVPEKPEVDLVVNQDGGLDLLAEWQKDVERQKQRHVDVESIFDGGGVGSDFDDVKGTAYGAFNSIAEYEQYARPRSRNDSFVFGAGARRMHTALHTLLAKV